MTHIIDTLEGVRQFLDGTDEIDLAIDGKKNRYDFIKHNRSKPILIGA